MSPPWTPPPPTPPPRWNPPPPPSQAGQGSARWVADALAQDQIRRQQERRGAPPAPAPLRAIGFVIKLAVFAGIVAVAIAMARGAFDQQNHGTGPGTGIESPAPPPEPMPAPAGP